MSGRGIQGDVERAEKVVWRQCVEVRAQRSTKEDQHQAGKDQVPHCADWSRLGNGDVEYCYLNRETVVAGPENPLLGDRRETPQTLADDGDRSLAHTRLQGLKSVRSVDGSMKRVKSNQVRTCSVLCTHRVGSVR